jgi:GNAT superfamily N-acetyltransferase
VTPSPREPNVLIRRLGRGDATLLERVAPDVFGHPLDAQLGSAFLADPRQYLVVALAGAQVVGFASAVHCVHPDKPAELFVNAMRVSPRYRRRGIARRLLAVLIEHGRALGCRQAWAATEAGNAPVRALFVDAGGCECAEPFVMVRFDLDARTWVRRPKRAS